MKQLKISYKKFSLFDIKEKVRWIKYLLDMRVSVPLLENFLKQQKQEDYDRVLEMVERAKLPYPNPYGKFVRVERVNGVILGELIKSIQQLKVKQGDK